jgi:predicted RNA-binding protein with PUA-like domain
MMYWLFKSDPDTYSLDHLQKDGKTNWNGIRNYQARNYLKETQKGDLVIIYHSGDEKAVVGLAEIIKGGYPEIDEEDGCEWVQVDLKFKEKFKNPIHLNQIKSHVGLKDMALLKQPRLSVMPLTPSEFQILIKAWGLRRLGCK